MPMCALIEPFSTMEPPRVGDAPVSRALGNYHDQFLEESGHRAKSELVMPIGGKEPPTRPIGS